MEHLLQVDNLTIALPAMADRRNAVSGLDLRLGYGETLCLVGESGSGKSMTAHALMGLLPSKVSVTGGRILLEGASLLEETERGMRSLRGRRIGMVFQEPMTSLNPLLPVGRQVGEVLLAHGRPGRRQVRARILELLEEVGLPEPARIADAYPHQLSGGQRQRVMIAIAIALKPALLIADEPTTALDVTTQAQILDLLDTLRRSHGMSMLFITHDLGVVKDIADRIMVLRHGICVEQGTSEDIFERAEHPYTKELLAAVPSLAPPPAREISGEPVLEVRSVKKTFGLKTLFSRGRTVKAADDISFILRAGETIGVVGESGSGKSTIGRCCVRLVRPDSGSIILDGLDVGRLSDRAFRAHRHKIQMVFQDPFASLNPRQTVGSSIEAGPLANGVSRREAAALAEESILRVGLSADALRRYPHEFSGGQRQRIGIARALALKPKILIADEAVSALDVSVQARVLDLLKRLQRELGLAILFVTHDLRVASQLCDGIVVMERGRVVESGRTAEIFANPQHPYTRRLLSAVPGQRATLQKLS